MNINTLLTYIEEGLRDGRLTKDSPVYLMDSWGDLLSLNNVRSDSARLVLAEQAYFLGILTLWNVKFPR